MKLLYYITSHGYGHAARTVALCNKVPLSIDIIFKTTVPHSFFLQEMSRPFSYELGEFDCGCVQTDGVTVDIDATLSKYRAIAMENANKLEHESKWCRENGIGLIASDIVPFAFEVAFNAKIPSLAITNFTWHTIYKEYISRRPDFSSQLQELENQYALADSLLALYPACDMPYFKKVIPAGPVGRIGNEIRNTLSDTYGISSSQKIGLIYTGNFGMNAVNWERLEQFEAWEFFGLYPLPRTVKNYHCIGEKQFPYQDFVASADVMISKLGYGTCAECFVNGLPIVYLPRRGFAEYETLAHAVTRWGYGYELSAEMFNALEWADALQTIALRPKPRPSLSMGIETCVNTICNMFENSQYFA